MAGPWFTVQKSGSGWKQVDTIWISNVGKNAKARVEIKVELEEPESGTPRTAKRSRNGHVSVSTFENGVMECWICNAVFSTTPSLP